LNEIGKNNSIDYVMFGILIVMAVLFRIMGVIFWAIIYGVYLMGKGALRNSGKNIKIYKIDWIIISIGLIIVLYFIITTYLV